MRITTRLGLCRFRIQLTSCGERLGKFIWRADIKRLARPCGEELISGPDMGGGWMNGRGDDTMTMFFGYGHILEFFTSFDWWQTGPHDDFVDHDNYCLAKPGSLYAIYLPKGGKVGVALASGTYEAKWFNPQTGEWIPIEGVVFRR